MLVGNDTPQDTVGRVKYIINFLAKQGRPSIEDREGDIGRCMYRSDDGKLACAVGCLIPDNKYDPRFENNSIQPLISKFGRNPTIEGLKKDKNILEELQITHDSYYSNIYRPIGESLKKTIIDSDLSKESKDDICKLIDEKDWTPWKNWRIEKNLPVD